MRKNQFVLRKIKQAATCALAVTIVATSTPSPVALASNVSGTEESVETVVEEADNTTEEGTANTQENTAEEEVLAETQEISADSEETNDTTTEEQSAGVEDELIVENVNSVTESEVENVQGETAGTNSFGSEATVLEAGSYYIPVAMKKADNVSAASNAASAIESVGVLTVSEDGTATLQTKWKTLYVMSVIPGDVNVLSIFQSSDYISDEAKQGIVDAVIDTTRTSSDTKQGDKLFPEKMTFSIPEGMKGENGVYISMDTTAGAFTAFLLVDYANAQAIEETISLDKTTLEVPAKSTGKLTATLPSNGIDKTAVFTSSDTSVATVDADGNVKGIAEGTATITATANGSSVDCVVTVTPAVKYTFGTTGVQLEEGTYYIPVSMKKADNVSAASNAASALESYGVLTVSEDGTAALQTKWKTLYITMYGMNIPGDVNVLSIFQSSDYTSDEAKQGIVDAVIDTTRTSSDTKQGDKLFPEKMTFGVPEGMGDKDGVFISMATTAGAFTAFLLVDYANAQTIQETISLDKTTLEVPAKSTGKLTATLPSNGIDKTAVFTSSDTSVATVDANGNVKGLAEGTVTITAAANGSSVTCAVTVTPAIQYSFGTKGAQLEAGTYFVPVSMKKSADINTESYAASAVETIGVLNVLEDGSATLQTTWKTLYAFGVSPGDTTALHVYKTTDYSSNAETVTATVDTKRTLSGIEYPEKMTFTIPDAMKSADGVYILMDTNVGSFPAAYLAIDYVNRQGIALNRTSAAIEKDETTTVSAAFLDNETHTVVYESSNEAVATVDTQGKITGVSEGTATITVKEDGSELSATYTVTVVNKTALREALEQVKDINNDTGKYTSASFTVLASVISSARSVLDGTEASQTAIDTWAMQLINAKNNLVETSISLNKTEVTLYTKGDNATVTLVATVKGDSKTVEWTSSDESIATVSGGVVTAISEGTVTITATANGISATSNITVVDKTFYSFGSAGTQLEAGTYFVPVSLKKADDTNSSSMAATTLNATAIVTVAKDGTASLQTKWGTLVMGGINGSVVDISVFQAEDYNSDEAKAEAVAAIVDTYRTVSYSQDQKPEKVTITIPSGMYNQDGVYVLMGVDIGMVNSAFISIDYTKAQAVSISLNKETLKIVEGNAETLTAILPEDGMDTKAVFTSSDTSVATIDANGTVTAVSAGTATITATANKVTATCVVTVEEKSVIKTDKTALANVLSSAKAINNANGIYLAASFTKLANAITAAQAVYNNENATQSEVDAQAKELTNAIQALQKSSISLNQKAATIYTKTGTTTVTLAATVVGDNKNVTWTSSNQAIAKVDAKGLVTAVSAGTATITASANGVSASAQVTVKAPSLTLESASGVVAVGGKITIGAVSDPAGKITYTTSNKKIATVDSKGVVKGIKKGSAKITVTSNGISKTFKVTVKTQTLKLKKSSATVTAGKTVTINATASPVGTITYKSSNKKVATVNANGVVKGVKAGTATITVKCNGVSKTFKVTVKKQTLTLKKTSASIKVGKTIKINATASPKGTITYKSSNEKVATVSSKGVVTGIEKGKAKITVTCNGVSKTFNVTVK